MKKALLLMLVCIGAYAQVQPYPNNVVLTGPLTAKSPPILIGGGGSSIPQMTFTPNSGQAFGLGMSNGGSQLLVFSGNSQALGITINQVTMRTDGALYWSTSTSNLGTTTGADISESSPGVLSADTSTAGNGLGSWIMAALTASTTITNTGITTDATHTDTSVCQDTTSHSFYFGSGTIGICLGTSSARYKHGWRPLHVGLSKVMQLNPGSYYLNADHGDPDKTLYGFTAEDMQPVLPQLVGLDKDGKPNTADYIGLIPVLVKAIQDQQHEIDALKRKIKH
jgi:hypothetical protein